MTIASATPRAARRPAPRTILALVLLAAAGLGAPAWPNTRSRTFELRSFHDEVLSYGAIPMSALRRLVLKEETAAPANPPGD